LFEWHRGVDLPSRLRLIIAVEDVSKISLTLAAALLYMNKVIGTEQKQLNARALALLSQLIEEEYGRVNVLTDPHFEAIRQALVGITADTWPAHRERERV
jgi:hypothetical protein